MAFWDVWELMLTFNTRFAISAHLLASQKNRLTAAANRDATASSVQLEQSAIISCTAVSPLSPATRLAHRASPRAATVQNFAERAPSQRESKSLASTNPFQSSHRLHPHRTPR